MPERTEQKLDTDDEELAIVVSDADPASNGFELLPGVNGAAILPQTGHPCGRGRV